MGSVGIATIQALRESMRADLTANAQPRDEGIGFT
jgi:hypothetical protein